MQLTRCIGQSRAPGCHPLSALRHSGFVLMLPVMDLRDRTGADPIRPGTPRRRAAARRPRGCGCGSSCSGPTLAHGTPRPSTATGLAALREDRQNRPQPGAVAGAHCSGRRRRRELDNALTTPAPFRERLVWFWTNHFTVSAAPRRSPRLARRLRRGGDPPARDRPLRGHAARGHAPSRRC